tara:strand:- start:1203 stop:1451 length:249 start_codon:yes stop_codon:yes gene_type:complete
LSKIKIKKRKRSESQGTQPTSGFLSNLIPDKLELTIRVPEEDKEVILEKLEDTKNEMMRNWRIVQIIMATGIVLSVLDKMFL